MKLTISGIDTNQYDKVRQLLVDALSDFQRVRSNGQPRVYVAFRYGHSPGTKEFDQKVAEVEGRLNLRNDILKAVWDMEVDESGH